MSVTALVTHELIPAQSTTKAFHRATSHTATLALNPPLVRGPGRSLVQNMYSSGGPDMDPINGLGRLRAAQAAAGVAAGNHLPSAPAVDCAPAGNVAAHERIPRSALVILQKVANLDLQGSIRTAVGPALAGIDCPTAFVFVMAPALSTIFQRKVRSLGAGESTHYSVAFRHIVSVCPSMIVFRVVAGFSFQVALHAVTVPSRGAGAREAPWRVRARRMHLIAVVGALRVLEHVKLHDSLDAGSTEAIPGGKCSDILGIRTHGVPPPTGIDGAVQE
eukprot:258245-Rhodomonas_salina.1